MPQSNPTIKEDKLPETAEEYLALGEQLTGGKPVKVDEVVTTTTSAMPEYIEQVNKLIKEVTVGEDGKFVYPDNTPEHLKYAVATEKKARDNQASFTKANTNQKGLEAENKALREQLAKSAPNSGIPAEELEALEELKFTDPDKWFEEKSKLEASSQARGKAHVDKQFEGVKEKASAEIELERRINVLADFNKGRSVAVTADTLDNDVPARITNKLAKGLLTFEGYLAEVDTYLTTNKVVVIEATDNGATLTSGAGGADSQTSEVQDLENTALDYSQMTF